MCFFSFDWQRQAPLSPGATGSTTNLALNPVYVIKDTLGLTRVPRLLGQAASIGVRSRWIYLFPLCFSFSLAGKAWRLRRQGLPVRQQVTRRLARLLGQATSTGIRGHWLVRPRRCRATIRVALCACGWPLCKWRVWTILGSAGEIFIYIYRHLF